MEFRFNVNDILQGTIVEIGPSLIPPGVSYSDKRALWDAVNKVAEVVNVMGEASAVAQGLTKSITTADRLRNSEQKVYLLVDTDSNSGQGAVTGMLKTGKKGLYVFDREGHHYQVQPSCVLDFYIHESKQRMGLGKKLFEHMLAEEKVEPVKLAIDRPSEKFLGFLNKHYALSNPVRQMNNFVVFDGFFPEPVGGRTKGDNSEVPATRPNQAANGLQTNFSTPYGRYGAPRPPCSMGQIIHNQSPLSHQAQEPSGTSLNIRPARKIRSEMAPSEYHRPQSGTVGSAVSHSAPCVREQQRNQRGQQQSQHGQQQNQHEQQQNQYAQYQQQGVYVQSQQGSSVQREHPKSVVVQPYQEYVMQNAQKLEQQYAPSGQNVYEQQYIQQGQEQQEMVSIQQLSQQNVGQTIQQSITSPTHQMIPSQPSQQFTQQIPQRQSPIPQQAMAQQSQTPQQMMMQHPVQTHLEHRAHTQQVQQLHHDQMQQLPQKQMPVYQGSASMQQPVSIQQPAPIQHTVPMQHTVPIQQSAPIQQTVPFQQNVPTQQPVLMQQHVPTQQSVALGQTVTQQMQPSVLHQIPQTAPMWKTPQQRDIQQEHLQSHMQQEQFRSTSSQPQQATGVGMMQQPPDQTAPRYFQQQVPYPQRVAQQVPQQVPIQQVPTQQQVPMQQQVYQTVAPIEKKKSVQFMPQYQKVSDAMSETQTSYLQPAQHPQQYIQPPYEGQSYQQNVLGKAVPNRYMQPSTGATRRVKTENAAFISSQRLPQEQLTTQQIQSSYIEPVIQNIQPAMQNIQTGMQNIQPAMQNIQPAIQNIQQPAIQNIQPSMQNIQQPAIQNIQPSIQNIQQPAIQNIQPGIQHIQPAMQNIQSSMHQIQPAMQHIQPAIQVAQPNQVQQQLVQPTQRSVVQMQQHDPQVYFSQPNMAIHQQQLPASEVPSGIQTVVKHSAPQQRQYQDAQQQQYQQLNRHRSVQEQYRVPQHVQSLATRHVQPGAEALAAGQATLQGGDSRSYPKVALNGIPNAGGDMQPIEAR